MVKKIEFKLQKKPPRSKNVQCWISEVESIAVQQYCLENETNQSRLIRSFLHSLMPDKIQAI